MLQPCQKLKIFPFYTLKSQWFSNGRRAKRVFAYSLFLVIIPSLPFYYLNILINYFYFAKNLMFSRWMSKYQSDWLIRTKFRNPSDFSSRCIFSKKKSPFLADAWHIYENYSLHLPTNAIIDLYVRTYRINKEYTV